MMLCISPPLPAATANDVKQKWEMHNLKNAQHKQVGLNKKWREHMT